VPKILVFYYTRTGNTEKMARAVVEGVRAVPGTDVELSYYVPAETLDSYDGILVGTPTYHHDVPIGVKQLFEEAAVKNVALKGKVGAAFGSYGWSGEAPKMAVEVMTKKFEMNVAEHPLLAKYTPDQASLEKCQELGRRIAEKLRQG
jgi:flavorubredoxin